MKTNKEIQQEFSKALSFNSKDDRYEHDAKMIMSQFLSEISKVMEINGVNKKTLAQMINTSGSFITQLFRGDKIISLITLAKIQHELDLTFKIELNEKSYVDSSVLQYLNTIEQNGTKGFWAYHRSNITTDIDYQVDYNTESQKSASI